MDSNYDKGRVGRRNLWLAPLPEPRLLAAKASVSLAPFRPHLSNVRPSVRLSRGQIERRWRGRSQKEARPRLASNKKLSSLSPRVGLFGGAECPSELSAVKKTESEVSRELLTPGCSAPESDARSLQFGYRLESSLG